MNIITLAEKNSPKTVATIGFFDGVHRGHRYLIEELKQIAQQKNQQSLVITFAVHPRQVLQANFQLQLLTSPAEKLARLEETGIDFCALLEFTQEMSKLSAYDFMKTVLKEQYNISTLLIGHDHRFGRNREEGFEEYRKYGELLNIELIQAQEFSFESCNKISSSMIRNKIKEGEMQEANKMLGYQFSLKGTVVGGYKIGRKLGFPTANIRPDNFGKIIPATGVYVVSALTENEKFFGMLNIGTRPTLQNSEELSIEVHLFDFDKEIYGREIQLSFIKRIRDEQKFANINDLISQLEKDKELALETVKGL